MTTSKQQLIAEGKAKSLYATDDPQVLLMEFRDDTSAYDGAKKAALQDKGAVNNAINELVMQHLESAGVATHLLQRISPTESLVRRLQMLPLEAVVRNIATGSLCRRLGVQDRLELSPPLFEFFLKDDERGDPLVTEHHIAAFSWATPQQVRQMHEISLRVNEILSKLFADVGIILVDFKLEFGAYEGEEGVLYLGDEFTPDGCRLWDADTRDSLDKDRFRNDMGDVVEAYQQVAQRLGVSG